MQFQSDDITNKKTVRGRVTAEARTHPSAAPAVLSRSRGQRLVNQTSTPGARERVARAKATQCGQAGRRGGSSVVREAHGLQGREAEQGTQRLPASRPEGRRNEESSSSIA